jgi:hypothetical protein
MERGKLRVLAVSRCYIFLYVGVAEENIWWQQHSKVFLP